MSAPDLLVSSARLSDDGVYRYTLERRWSPEPGVDTWLMLNPSTADAHVDDPTIRRCMGFSRRWGASGIRVVNLFALRAVDPNALRRHPDPIGPDNDQAIYAAVAHSRLSGARVIAAWGSHVMSVHRARHVYRLIGDPLSVLGLTRGRHPRHPLYMRGDVTPSTWAPR